MPGNENAFTSTHGRIVDPELRIIDCHHHIRDVAPHPRYLFPEFLADLSSGHNVVGTVAVEFGDMYRSSDDPALRPAGETEFFNGLGAMFASGKYGHEHACGAIVGFANLTLGKAVEPLLDAHVAAGNGRFRGVRVSAHWHEDFVPDVLRWRYSVFGLEMKQHLLRDPLFREGLSCLAPRNLSYDATIYHTQIPDLIDLARAFPETTIIAGHFVLPLGVGPLAGKYEEVFPIWLAGLRELARCPNVYVKMAGLRWAGIPIPGYGMDDAGGYDGKPGADEFAKAWRPYIDGCVQAFGPDRCMFASNFPPEGVVCDYVTRWNAYKIATESYSAEERNAIFFETANKVYRFGI